MCGHAWKFYYNIMVHVCIHVCACVHVHANTYSYLHEANYSTKFDTKSILFCRCGHCKRLAPEYESAATELSLASPPVALAKVDATVETSLANRFGINGYPTLKVFHQGTPYDYEGPRTAQGQTS